MRRKGFTLVEIMIVVAIIGILAAIAIPNWFHLQARAKRAELSPNISGIQTAELAYNAAFDSFVSEASWRPDSSPAKNPRPWVSGSGFDTLGWTPDGLVRGSYTVSTSSSTDFLVRGVTDVDGDSSLATFTATSTINATMVTEGDTY